jgi:hypothetical protein
MKIILGILLSITLIASICMPLYAQTSEELQYKRVKLDDVTCDAGVACRKTPQGMDIVVSAIAFGKFQDFRRWRVEKIKLRIGDARIRPDNCQAFFVRKASFWKYPAAVLWAVIGSQYNGLNNYGTFAEGAGKIGMAVGLGILTLQAKGDIPGQRCIFYLRGDAANSINYGVDSVRIDILNNDTNQTENITVILEMPSQAKYDSDGYNNMTKDQLSSKLGEFDGKIAGLEEELESCKSSPGKQCRDIQSTIDTNRARQAMVYKAWSEK